jgi:adenylate cyclase
MWQTSPFYRALETHKSLRVRLSPPPSPIPFPIVEDLMARGMTDYVVFPLESGPAVSVVVSIATQRPNGFPDAFVSAFEALIPTLSLSVAYKVERFQFRQVLSAYIGREPALRVLNGQIRRGDVITRQASIGFADLRGFTAATARLPSDELLELLGSFFEQVGHAVHEFHGEILKFMGDGVLFIFPDNGQATATCNRATKPTRPIRFGCALHFGEVLFGNIGAPSRLDFTVLGHAVNLTSRLESLTGQLDEVCLLSERFAQLATEPTQAVGTFALKGLEEAQVVYRSIPDPEKINP